VVGKQVFDRLVFGNVQCLVERSLFGRDGVEVWRPAKLRFFGYRRWLWLNRIVE
jgi:hypothetical protein